MRVLVVDDDASVRSVACRILARHQDVEITQCENGVDALEALTVRPYSLVLLDVHMPTLGGVDVLRAIRQSPMLRALPVIMMTAENDADHVRNIAGLGVAAYAVKPLRPCELNERVAAVLAGIRASEPPVIKTPRPFEALRLSQSTRVVVADGDAEFRQFSTKTLGRLCAVTAVASGVDALRLCQDQRAYAVFIGSDLGLLNATMLAGTIRASGALERVRVVGIQPPRLLVRARKQATYEAVIMRSFVPEVFMEGVGTLLYRPGQMPGLLAMVPDLKLIGIAAAEEALSTALGQHFSLRPTRETPRVQRMAEGMLAFAVGDDQTPLALRLSAPQRSLRRVTDLNAPHTSPVNAENALLSLISRIGVGSSRVDLQACKLEYSIVSPK